jgi:hypothetical protein
MLNKEDLQFISDKFDTFEAKIDKKFEQFAVMIKNALDTKPDREELNAGLAGVQERLTKRIDVLEYKIVNSHERRLDMLEDDVRYIKTKLQLS